MSAHDFDYSYDQEALDLWHEYLADQMLPTEEADPVIDIGADFDIDFYYLD